MRRGTLFLIWLAVTAAASATLFIPFGRIGCSLAICFATAAFALYSYGAWRRLAAYLRKLEDYAALLPSNEITLPDTLPTEFAMLSSALRRASQHVSSVIDRANLELDRRETILAAMAEGVLAVDGELRVTFSNDAFAEAFQTRRALPEGLPLYEVVREPALRTILEDVLEAGQPVQRVMHLPSAGGRWFAINALPLGHSPRFGAIAVLHDVTDIQRQEQARKDFVANVSHELRTPLAAIRGYAETLLDGGLEDPVNNRKFIEVIQSHAIRLNNIAQDLLVLSELDSRARTIAPAPVRLREAIESAVRTVEGAASMRDVTVAIRSCDDSIALGSRLRLEQVLVNLLDNAVKFNRSAGTVTVDCGLVLEGNMVAVSVSDTGIGIPSEDLSRIFERFYRVDRARSRQAGGTGLGLSIVKESIEGMGGSVTVESQLGQGTRFTIQIPAANPAASEMGTAAPLGGGLLRNSDHPAAR